MKSLEQALAKRTAEVEQRTRELARVAQLLSDQRQMLQTVFENTSDVIETHRKRIKVKLRPRTAAQLSRAVAEGVLEGREEEKVERPFLAFLRIIFRM